LVFEATSSLIKILSEGELIILVDVVHFRNPLWCSWWSDHTCCCSLFLKRCMNFMY